MNMKIRIMTKPENLFVYTDSRETSAHAGLIGYLRADMDTNGEGFFSTWWRFNDDLKTQEFKDEFDEVINSLRFGDGEDAFLKNRAVLSKWCYTHMDAMLSDERSFGARVDTAKYAYLMRLNPNKGEYNLYCYCYVKEHLDRFLKASSKGIKFIDSHYNELFRIPDGGKIRLTYSDGERAERRCRFIDEYHTEIGDHIFHICQFAEIMERNGTKYEPVEKT